VIGEFQPHVRVEGKRVAEGESVPGYYPAIMDEELFYQAQFATSQRRESGAGRKGVAFTNLFSGIAKCAYCRSPILFENKGEGAKGGKYLVCDGAKRQRGCPGLRWRYQDFEASFLAFVEELDIEGVINATSHFEKRDQLERDIAALKGELLNVNGLMEKTYAVLNQGGPVEFVTAKLNELEQRRTELTKGLGTKSLEQQELLSRESRYHRGKEEIRQLVEMLQSPSSEDLFKIRAKVASQLKALIDTLLVASIGESPRLRQSIDELKVIAAEGADDVIAHMEQRAAHPDQSKRYFSVAFRDSAVRIVFPDADDPLRYQQQIVAKAGLIDLIQAE